MPSARVRFAIEAAFLLIVAAGAVLAKLSLLQIILAMFVAWVLLALVERASSRARRHSQEPVPEAEAEPSELDAELTELLAAESLTPGPVVTKRPLDLPGPEEKEAAPPVPEPAPAAPTPAPREWNLWELERRARDYAGDAARDEEWTALFVHLRQFADTEGQLPEEFDGLVRESFAELIQAA
jgi:hypothetical protein